MFDIPDIVIFDLDDTLYEYERAHKSGQNSLVEFLSTHLRTPKPEIEEMLTVSRSTVKERLGNVSSSHSRLLYIRELLNNYSFQMHSTFAIECEQVFWRAYLEQTIMLPGVDELISSLRLAGTKLVLVTDLSTNIQLRKLSWLGLDKAFELIITSEEAGGDKTTGLPEMLLRKHLSPTARTWSIGDQDFDHIFRDESIFFKKVSFGKLRTISENSHEFSDYLDLIRKLKSPF
jgi:FMN phosphatase YigB (HAD superfamily)